MHYRYQSLPHVSASLGDTIFAPSALEYYWLNRPVRVQGRRGFVRLIGARTRQCYVQWPGGGGTVVPVSVLRGESVDPVPWWEWVRDELRNLRSRFW